MNAEKEFMGSERSRVWSYLILAALMVIGALIANLVWSNPEIAKHGIKSFFGLPGWALAAITCAIGVLVYWLGLKIETDWPEAIGAFLIASSVTAGEFLIGWKHFEFGLVVLPYLIPLGVFVVLLMIGMKKSA